MALSIAAAATVLILLSIAGGLLLHDRLPEAHVSGDSKEVILLATALIGTLAAMVLALLFAATRSHYETTNGHVVRLTAGVVELDHLLKEYGGPDSVALRTALRTDVRHMIAAIWRDAAAPSSDLMRPVVHEETVLYKLRELVPGTTVQTSIHARAVVIGADINRTWLTLFAQPDDALSMPFIMVLVAWLCFIFASFSMSSRANPTLVVVLFVCASTASTAIYLILELGQPFDGMLQISARSLTRALPPLS